MLLNPPLWLCAFVYALESPLWLCAFVYSVQSPLRLYALVFMLFSPPSLTQCGGFRGVQLLWLWTVVFILLNFNGS